MRLLLAAVLIGAGILVGCKKEESVQVPPPTTPEVDITPSFS